MKTILFATYGFIGSVVVSTWIASSALASERPNILVIMVDDLGYSDIACYGGEIATPNLDALAAGGLRYSQFYNTAKCHSSRVSLLTGQYCIAAGDTALTHAVTTAEVLRGSGYSTAMTGKWHLQQEPSDFGFDRYFGHLSGACNYFRGDGTFRLNGEKWQVPSNGFYTTVANVDYGLKFLKEAQSKTDPWYLYVAFNAPHAPLQALPEDYAKYSGRYDQGWDTMRDARFARQRELGILPASLNVSPRPAHVPAWDTLSEPRKAFEIKRMQTLAAMIDRVDQEIGRIVAHLKASDQFDNTLIWFVSDNGACPYDRTSNAIAAEPTDGSVSWSDSTGWAWARNCPFRFYKQNQFEGGISTPAIVHWPAGLKAPAGSICNQPAHLIDIMPTIADVTQATIPTSFPGRELRPISGQSLAATFAGGRIDRKQPLHLLFASDRGLRDGDWKAVSFRSSAWELYNVAQDRTELNDLASQHPERLQAMVARWTQMANDVLHANARTTAPVSDRKPPHQHPEWTNFAKDPVAGVRGNSKSGGEPKSNKSNKNANGNKGKGRWIRARKNTSLEFEDELMKMTFTGPDPGIVVDLPVSIPRGPYVLEFELSSTAQGNGEVFFTIDQQTPLNKGLNIPFTVVADGQWHAYRLELKTDQRILKLRLDVADGVGTAMLKYLRISHADANPASNVMGGK